MISLVLLAALAAAPDAAAVLKSLETAGRDLKTMKASFVETKVLTLLNEKQETRGNVFLQVPGRLRWDYVSPQPGVMMIKDGQFARYVPQTKQVFRSSPAYVLDLKPRTPGLFAGIRLWVDKARQIPVQTRLTEPTGDYTTIRFEDVVVNRPLPSTAFELKLPKDVAEVK
jgi:outer membrane lipoprotein-sorting protein